VHFVSTIPACPFSRSVLETLNRLGVDMAFVAAILLALVLALPAIRAAIAATVT
jgi:hypothetical protein